MKTALVLCSMLAMACAQTPSGGAGIASLIASMSGSGSAAGGEASSGMPGMGSMGFPPGLSMSGSSGMPGMPGMASLMSGGMSGSGSGMSSGAGMAGLSALMSGMGSSGGARSAGGSSGPLGGGNMLTMMAASGNGRMRNMMKMQTNMNIALGRCNQIGPMHRAMMFAGRLGKRYLYYVLFINPLVTNGLSHPYHLDESTSILRGIRRRFSFFFSFFDEN